MLESNLYSSKTRHKIDGQILVMMLGVPGSGKSTFARQLSERLRFDRFSTDAIRTELYGRPDPQLRTETGLPISAAEKKRIQKQTFSLLDQRLEEALLAGRSVIRDHMHHSRHWREIGRKQAATVGALAIMIWIKTPCDLAHKRGLARKLKEDQRVETDSEAMRKSISFYHNTLDLPAKGEICLEIDGRANFKEQLRCFLSFLHRQMKSNEDVSSTVKLDEVGH